MITRALTGMLAAVLLGGDAAAQESPASKSLFTPCAVALPTAAFAPLRAVIPEHLAGSSGCLRLTNQEFLLFNQPDGPGNPFHYCDLRTAPPACKEEPHWFYTFEINEQFTGAHGQRFMLWYTWQMKRGVMTDGYGIVSLVPKSQAARGFEIYALSGGYIFKGEDPSTADPCRDLSEDATEITGYELRGDGSEDVELRFNKRTIDCQTRQESLSALRYRPKTGRFELVP